MPRIIAHKGFAIPNKENTLAAVRNAVHARIPAMAGIEIDIQLTADGRIVMWHDADMKQIVGRDAVIRETSYAALARMTCDHPHFSGDPIALLEDVLQAADHATALYIEIKAYPYDHQALADALCGLLTSYAPKNDIIIHSFSSDMLMRVKKTASPKLSLRYGYLFSSISELSRHAEDFIASMDYLHPLFSLLYTNAADIASCRKPLNIWTVNDPAEIPRLKSSAAWDSIDCIITDNDNLHRSF